jgi:hypothetical protein
VRSWRGSGWADAFRCAARRFDRARAGERDRLNACMELVDRAAQERQAGAAPGGAVEDAELQKCRQIIKEWTLRDSRMSVDEQGRPLR